MKIVKVKILALALVLTTIPNAQAGDQQLHTEDNEIVCQMDDFLATRIYVDRDVILDNQIGKVSSKILVQPTQNAYAYNNELFQIELVKVFRARCIGCEDSQVILYKLSDGTNTINKLEVTRSKATVTINVDSNGNPLHPSFKDQGICELNEVE